MKRVLVVEFEERFAARLFQVLQDAGEYEVSSARTMREAFLILAQQPQDIAFIPAAEHDNVIRSLRTLRPSLPLIAVTERASEPLPAAFQGEVDAVLGRNELERNSVRAALARATGEGVPDALTAEAGDDTQLPLVTRLRQACVAEKVLTCLVAEGERVVAHHGTLDEEEVEAVAYITGRSWRNGLTGQMQFVRLPTRLGVLLIYSLPLRGGRRLAVAAQPEMAVSRLRVEGSNVAAAVTSLGANLPEAGAPVVPPLPSKDEESADEQLFTISWRARSPLPDVLHVPLKRSLKKIAVTHGCTLSTLKIAGDQVYLVIACPPYRDGEWAAELLREGTEQAIQEQFGVSARLWAADYRVRPGRHPLQREPLSLSSGQ